MTDNKRTTKRGRRPAESARRLRQLLSAARASTRRHYKALAESVQLQKILRRLTHQVLTAQEEDRAKLSHGLQNEIAQTLLGVNVRLLSLKYFASGNSRRLKNEIASAQRLVLKSAQSVRRFARELNASSRIKRSARKFI